MPAATYSLDVLETGAPQGAGARIARPLPLPSGKAGVPQQSEETLALALHGISLSFGGVTALVDVDLSIAAGEIRAIIGPNGAGKSSLINVISGVYRSDRGHVSIGPDAYRHVPTERLASLGVARTFQNLALFKGLSVIDNVIAGRAHTVRSSFAGQILGLGRARREEADARERAGRVLEFLHLDHVGHRLAGTLPYGLQKRVELARALVAEPKILLLDEPMAGMGLEDVGVVSGIIRDVARDRAVLMVEHNLSVVANICQQVTVLQRGEILAEGDYATVSQDERVRVAYMGTEEH
ncbi:ABC transporter ATP-binding protein [Rhizobium phaseoli]